MFQKECTRCLLPEGKMNVVLDESGVCNYCHHWEKKRDFITDYNRHRPFLTERIQKLRGKGNYDALLGFSGGKDSTYVAHFLAHKLGLKPQLITVNNGFLNDYAMENIRSVVEKLGLEHFFHSFDWELQKILYKASFDVFGDPCIGCAIPLYYFTIKYAYENEIPMLFHGRTPYQIFRNDFPGTKDTFLELHETNYEPHSFTRLKEIYSAFSKQLYGWLEQLLPDDPPLRQRAHDACFFDVESADPEKLPDFIGLFQYEMYDEETIKSEMEKEVGYKRPTKDTMLGHGDCDIHDACAYLLRTFHGEVSTLSEIASMIRLGALTIEEARSLKARHEAAETVFPEASMKHLERATALSSTDLKRIIAEKTERGVQKFSNH